MVLYTLAVCTLPPLMFYLSEVHVMYQQACRYLRESAVFMKELGSLLSSWLECVYFATATFQCIITSLFTL